MWVLASTRATSRSVRSAVYLAKYGDYRIIQMDDDNPEESGLVSAPASLGCDDPVTSCFVPLLKGGIWLGVVRDVLRVMISSQSRLGNPAVDGVNRMLLARKRGSSYQSLLGMICFGFRSLQVEPTRDQ
jgi:hypothetical protein